MTNDRTAPVVAATVPTTASWRLWGSGIRKPLERPHPQARRQREEWVFFLVTDGAIDLIDETPDDPEDIRVDAGWLHLVPPGVWQTSRRPFPVGSCFLWWHLICDAPWSWLTEAEALAGIDADLASGRHHRLILLRHLDCRPALAELRQLHARLDGLAARWGPSAPPAAALANHLVWRLHDLGIDQVMRGSADRPHGDAATLLARRARWLINQNDRRWSTLGDLASELGVDSSYLARCFKRSQGETVGQAIRSTRMALACDLIAQGQHTLKEVARACGYTSLNYFCRQFRQEIGTSPGRWRSS